MPDLADQPHAASALSRGRYCPVPWMERLLGGSTVSRSPKEAMTWRMSFLLAGSAVLSVSGTPSSVPSQTLTVTFREFSGGAIEYYEEAE